VAQGVVHEDEGSHGLYNGHRARQDAGVMPAPGFERGVLEVDVHGILLMHDSGDGFEGDPEVDRLPV
jgi:hypothetical protein